MVEIMVQTFGLSCNQMKLLVSSKYYQYYRRSLFYEGIEYKTITYVKVESVSPC